MLEREPLRAPRRRRRSSRAFRHEGFWDCMDTYKDAVVLNDLWASGRGALADLGRGRGGGPREARRWSPAATASSPRTWPGRCSSAGDAVRVLDRPDPRRRRRRAAPLRPRPARDRAARSSWSRPTCATPSGSAPRSPAVRRRLPPRRADDRRRRPRCSPGWRPSRSTCAAPGTSSRPAASTRSPAVVFASSDKAYGASPELPYREDFPLRAAYPYDASKAAADVDRPQLRPRLRPAARGHPLRQHLRRRRPQLLAADPGGGRRGARRPAAGRSAPTAAPSATSSTSTTRSPPTWRSRAALGAGGPAAGEAFNAGGERPHSVREVRRADRRGSAAAASSPNTAAPATRTARSTASTSTRPSCAS